MTTLPKFLQMITDRLGDIPKGICRTDITGVFKDFSANSGVNHEGAAFHFARIVKRHNERVNGNCECVQAFFGRVFRQIGKLNVHRHFLLCWCWWNRVPPEGQLERGLPYHIRRVPA